MPERFLGVHIPNPREAQFKKRATTPREWVGLLLLSLILGVSSQLNRLPLFGQTVFYYPVQSVRVLAQTPLIPVAKPATVNAVTPLCSVYTSPVADTFNTKTLFPILPSIILNSDACSPPYWNLDVIKIFIYKIMALLNYLILVAAIMLTLYAGVMYLTGFQSEGNIKKAKTILAATYTGLILSLSATLILRTTISIAADSNKQTVIQDNNSAIFSGGASK